jgi:CRISPR-associated protein Cmr3
LYSSSGVRYADDVAIGAEVTHSLTEPKHQLFVLGGETRPVTRRPGMKFPAFDKDLYRQALGKDKKRPPGLLLMLVTPASFSTKEGDHGPGWLPSWLKEGTGEIEGTRLTLETIATDRFVPLSGWSMAHRDKANPQGKQRAVRRLVPAGTVYFLRPEKADQDAWVRLCEHFWGQPIDKSEIGDEKALLAAPWRDGYGMVIPGLYWPDGGV